MVANGALEVSKPDFGGIGKDEGLRRQISIFSELVVRDYLRKRGFEKTLSAFAREVAVTSPEPDMESWCTMGKLLSLPELLTANEKSAQFETILEVMTQELIRETSIKLRRPITLTISTSVPSCATVETSAFHVSTPAKIVAVPKSKSVAETARELATPKARELATANTTKQRQRSPVKSPPRTGTRSVSSSPVRGRGPIVVSQKQSAFSRENWIPIESRERMVERNLLCLNKNLDSLEAQQLYVANNRKHHQLSDLEHNQAAERYGIKKKRPCGLCEVDYSETNIALSVPLKAVYDLRAKWAQDFESHPAHCQRTKHVHRAFTYDVVGICAFCAQFFQLGQQDVYRPSLQTKLADKNRRLRKERDAKAKAYWDPVKQLELERQALQPDLQSTANCSNLEYPVFSCNTIPMGSHDAVLDRNAT